MVTALRRTFLGNSLLGGFALGAGVSRTVAAAMADGHAAGHDVAAASEHVPLIPRRGGDPVTFTASLDKAPAKATTGGWAREVTARQLPIATNIAGAHLFIGPGGAREMHWHNSDEWAYVLDGFCQVSIVDPAGETEVVNLGPGDLWYFPRGHAHAIQTLGSEPFHAILAFNDGLYGEHGTFGLSDWLSRLDPALAAHALGVPPSALAAFPKGETYINQGEIIPLDGEQARLTRQSPAARSHRFDLLSQPAAVRSPGGTIQTASGADFPAAAMTGVLTRLQPGAMHVLHWHPNADEWHYVARGRTRVTLFAADKHLAVAELSAGDCAYIPANCGHSVQNIGDGECEVVGVLNSGDYQESTLLAWLAAAPRHLLANNLGVQEAELANFRGETVIAAAG